MANKIWVNYIVDVGLLISFLIATITGILKWPGLLPAIGIHYRDVPLAKWTMLHDYSGLAMAALSLAHVILHWDWIKAMTKKAMSNILDKLLKRKK